MSVSSAGDPPNFLAWLADKVVPPLLSSTLVAVIAGIMIARSLERFKGRREHLTKSVDALRIQLAALQKVTGTYWSGNYDAKKSAAQEAEIEFLLADISSLTNICAPELWKDESDVGPMLVVELLSIATGEKFGASDRKRDVRRIKGVSLRAANLSSAVAVARSRYFSKKHPARRKARTSKAR
ncbi:hypothetical protein [Caulobacter sp. Root487D2Y]|uniref:hypothetical protein n=1 Tax=Caulobacter sp. Root487D2Y TaxID=1736547 RepID=UPI0012E337C4|nr:hypothetical protein [Caulobacter sp. Root487D2Y]